MSGTRTHKSEKAGRGVIRWATGFTAAMLVMLLPSVAMSAGGYLRWDAQSHRVDADLTDWKLARVVQEVARQSGWEIYAEADLTRRVSVRFQNLSEGEALSHILGNLSYAVVRPDEPPRLYIFATSMSAARTRVEFADQGRESDSPALKAALERMKPENLTESHRLDVEAFGTNAVADLTAGLSSPDPEVRRAAAAALGFFGEAAEPSVDSLITALSDADLQVQLRSAAALGQLRLAPDRVLPLLVQNLQHTSPVVRAWNADAIANFGPLPADRADGIVTLLQQGLNDTSPMVRSHYEQAIARLNQPVPAGEAEP